MTKRETRAKVYKPFRAERAINQIYCVLLIMYIIKIKVHW